MSFPEARNAHEQIQCLPRLHPIDNFASRWRKQDRNPTAESSELGCGKMRVAAPIFQLAWRGYV